MCCSVLQYPREWLLQSERETLWKFAHRTRMLRIQTCDTTHSHVRHDRTVFIPCDPCCVEWREIEISEEMEISKFLSPRNNFWFLWFIHTVRPHQIQRTVYHWCKGVCIVIVGLVNFLTLSMKWSIFQPCAYIPGVLDIRVCKRDSVCVCACDGCVCVA